MGKPAARLGDMHMCPMVTPGTPPVPHVGGPITGPGVPTVLIGGMPAAVMGDMCTCVGPPDSIILGSTGVLIGGKPAARMGDSCAHGGAITVGCVTVLIGEVGGGGGNLSGESVSLGGTKGGKISGKTGDPGNPASREKMAREFYENAGWSKESIDDHMKGIDFSKPVEIVELPAGTKLSQWQAPGQKQGNYFAEEGTDPAQLGISPNAADKFNANKRIPKSETIYTSEKPVVALKSTASPAIDTWSESIKGPESTANSFVMVRSVKTSGGATQFFVPENTAFK